jgi:hypothetical protein
MEISKLDYRKLKALQIRLDSLLSEIGFELKLMHQSEVVELEAFLYVLDPAEIPSKEKGCVLPSDYNKEHVLQIVLELKEYWETFRYWYYEGKLVTFVEWKSVWNRQAQRWNKPLLM